MSDEEMLPVPTPEECAENLRDDGFHPEASYHQQELENMLNRLRKAQDESKRAQAEKEAAVANRDEFLWMWKAARQHAEALETELREAQAEKEAAVAAEREACAEIADEYKARADEREQVSRRVGKWEAAERHSGQSGAAASIANAIRARADTDALAARYARVRAKTEEDDAAPVTVSKAARKRVARAIAYVDWERDKIGEMDIGSGGFSDDWVGSRHYEMADAILALIPDTGTKNETP